MRIEYEKLIRDRIPEIMDEAGVRYEVTTMDDEAYRASLRTKLVEEAREVLEASSEEELAKELADLLEVVHAVMTAEGLDASTVGAVRRARRESRGGFERRLKLHWTEEKGGHG